MGVITSTANSVKTWAAKLKLNEIKDIRDIKEIRLQEMGRDVDRFFERVFSDPSFLHAASTLLNLNSHRKIWVNRTLATTWKLLQLPNKRDQERTLHLIHELHHRIGELEARLGKRPASESPKKPARKSKPGATDPEPASIP